MQTLVADTSVIFNLGHRGELESLLGKLATKYQFITTSVVREECLRARRPLRPGQKPPENPEDLSLRAYYTDFLAVHFTIHDAENSAVDEADLRRLAGVIDPGEISVLLLAAERKATAVIDEKLARAEAKQMGLKLMGTLGLLEIGMKSRWLTDDDCLAAIDRLRANKFSIRKPGANESFAEYLRTI